jgi:hypothetical protein
MVNGRPWTAFTGREIRLGKRAARTNVVCIF